MTQTVTTGPSARDRAVLYAWWLTGDTASAQAAVDRAVSRSDIALADDDGAVVALLAAVRAEAISAPSMCPASELALLHDVHRLPLHDASQLVGIVLDDAGIELAHGRMEALVDEARQPFAHPARLGGLAVGNPDDVAHARQCASCGTARQLILRGREELRTLAQLPAQPELVADAGPATEPVPSRGPTDWARPFALGCALVAALIFAWAASSVPVLALVGTGALGLAIGVALHPPLAAYVYLAATPLIVGIDRGSMLPLLRPNEALVALLVAGLLLHWLVHAGSLRAVLRPTRVDAAFLLLAFAGSVLPILWLVARGEPVTQDDLLHTLTLWKYYVVFALFRASIRTEQQVRTCLWWALGSAAVVAVIAILQSGQWLGVPQLLATHYAPFGEEGALQINRGTSTIASSLGVANVLTFMLAVSLSWLLFGTRHRNLLMAASALFVVGTLASGRFSGVIALAVCLVVVGFVTGRLGRVALAAIPSAALGLLVLQPVIDERLSRVDPAQGLPSSWISRLENLQTYFWDELFTDLNWVFGVRPSARLPSSDSWREWIWIESGHTWLLWSGGIPFLVAFIIFLWVAIRTVAPIARERGDAIGVAATACLVSLWVVALLMAFDTHLTLRGSADLAFPLLALALTAYSAKRVSLETAGQPG